MTEQSALAGLVAVVTGGAGHLGTAMTASLARQGARVVVADVDGDRAVAHAGTLAGGGGEAVGVTLDVASEASVDAAFALVADRLGGVDLLVNNAAPSRLIGHDAAALDVDLDIWDAIHAVVVRGALLCLRRALPLMVQRGGGSVVNIASIHGHAGDADLTAYPVAKAALLGLTRSVATQYGHHGIRCNSVTLGTIPFPSMPASARQAKVRHQLVPREGRPEDVAALVAFLCSPASGFSSGADFRADGGVLAHLPSYADGGTFELLRPG